MPVRRDLREQALDALAFVDAAERLPRLATDQTASMIYRPAADPLPRGAH